MSLGGQTRHIWPGPRAGSEVRLSHSRGVPLVEEIEEDEKDSSDKELEERRDAADPDDDIYRDQRSGHAGRAAQVFGRTRFLQLR